MRDSIRDHRWSLDNKPSNAGPAVVTVLTLEVHLEYSFSVRGFTKRMILFEEGNLLQENIIVQQKDDGRFDTNFH